MPLPARTYSHKVAVDIPVEDFRLILDQEAVDDYRELEFPELTEILSGMEDVGDVEYDGHFGSAIYATFDLDDDGRTPQHDMFIENIEVFIEDLRRANRLVPGLFVFPRRERDDFSLEDENGRARPRKLLYSHPEFLLTDAQDGDAVTALHLKDGATVMTDIHAPAVRDTLFADLDLRSFDPHKRKTVNLSRNIPMVDAAILPHIIPENAMGQVRPVSSAPEATKEKDFSSHYLFHDLPKGATPLHASSKWIVADSGAEIGASVTFRTEGEAGTKYYLGSARDQILGLARANPLGLDKWLRTALPENLDGPSSHRLP